MKENGPMSNEPPRDHDPDLANPDWFREPSRREHWMGAALFVGFGVFFVLLFWVLGGWWFRWVVLGLGVYSVWHGLRHAIDARRSKA
jgi:fatty acid desaturase